MLEAAVDDRAEQLGLQEEIAEARGVDPDVSLLHSLAGLGSRAFVGRDLLLLVVEELLVLFDGLVVGHLYVCV